jgi:hypothetical protein
MASSPRSAQWSGIISFLQTSVGQMVRDKQILQSAGTKVSPRDVSQMMAATFYEAVETPREQYVHQLIDRLSAIQGERDDMEGQFVRLQATWQMDLGRASRKNDELRSEIDSLEAEFRALEQRQTRKEKQCQEQLDAATSELEGLSQFLALVHQSSQQLRRQVTEVRGSVNKMKRSQLHLLQQARTILSNQVDESLDRVSVQHRQEQLPKVRRISETLAEIQAEQLQLEEESKSLLDCIADITDNSKLRVTAHEEIPQKMAEIRPTIEKAIEVHREKATESIKQDVAQQFPGIDFGERAVSEAIKNYTLERIHAKELECEQILRKGEIREKKLREKLDGALRKIQTLQNTSQEDFQYLDEFEKSKREWEQQQRRLDAKMSVLTTQHKSGD